MDRETFTYGMGCCLFVVIIMLFVGALFCIHWEWSEDNVSGIVYNTTNNAVISGNTEFKIRASVDTYINQQNESSYCLPPNSPYKELVNKAAADKSIKVIVTTKKAFRLMAPWKCMDNTTVVEAK